MTELEIPLVGFCSGLHASGVRGKRAACAHWSIARRCGVRGVVRSAVHLGHAWFGRTRGPAMAVGCLDRFIPRRARSAAGTRSADLSLESRFWIHAAAGRRSRPPKGPDSWQYQGLTASHGLPASWFGVVAVSMRTKAVSSPLGPTCPNRSPWPRRSADGRSLEALRGHQDRASLGIAPGAR